MTLKKIFLFIFLVFVVASLACAEEYKGREGEHLIGEQASEWIVADWMNSRPLKLEDLRGKVVLVRFWTGPGCPFCRASVPALNEFHEKYRDKGLAVIGFYHHKSSLPLKKDRVKKLVQEFGFQFPVAIDYEWKTLRNWWLDRVGSGWTSVSFLIDKKGVVRHIHPGGQYVKGDKDYAALQAKIEELLAEMP